jgi:hypothetical protein
MKLRWVIVGITSMALIYPGALPGKHAWGFSRESLRDDHADRHATAKGILNA